MWEKWRTWEETRYQVDIEKVKRDRSRASGWKAITVTVSRVTVRWFIKGHPGPTQGVARELDGLNKSRQDLNKIMSENSTVPRSLFQTNHLAWSFMSMICSIPMALRTVTMVSTLLSKRS